jgi:hypothetical protein
MYLVIRTDLPGHRKNAISRTIGFNVGLRFLTSTGKGSRPLSFQLYDHYFMEKHIFQFGYLLPVYTSYACGCEKALQLINEYEGRRRKRKKAKIRLS